jgi:hypothetical protein
LKRGYLHVYLQDGNIKDIKDNLLARNGIYSVGIHLGNSDVVGQFAYKDSRDVLDLIAWSKHLEGVERVLWSEEVYAETASPKIEKMINKDDRRKTYSSET